LPPLAELVPLLQEIWDRRILTNGGPLHQQLEQALCEYFGVSHISLFANGTLALMVAIQAMRLSGEVITTPYSFVATTHALLWNGLKPVFVDIEPHTLNLNPARIEAAITSETSAILPVHCYGNPCNIDAIQAIADRHGLRVIYDAAHAFGVRCHCGSVLQHGDLSVLSFHASKVFNTLEGGAIVCPDAETKQRVDQLKNFGFLDETTIIEVGLNGKMNEVQAALGLLQLARIDQTIARRAEIDARYREALAGVPGIHCVPTAGQYVANHAYFPVLVGDKYPLTRDQLYEKLKSNGIHARRYFYPLISDFPLYRERFGSQSQSLDIALDATQRVICLPIYAALAPEDVGRITDLIVSA
jgi:dTDP-4-amino-4,6-dideoxygalactose transaminase